MEFQEESNRTNGQDEGEGGQEAGEDAVVAIKPVFYQSVTPWDVEQSDIIKRILMDDYKQYENDIQ